MGRVKQGDVYARMEDGAVAINVQGMPVELFTGYVKLITKELGAIATTRNATTVEVVEQLGYGVWFILAKAKADGTT